MSVEKWSYIPQKCDGDICIGDCDDCPKQDLCPSWEIEDCDSDCQKCWEKYGKENK